MELNIKIPPSVYGWVITWADPDIFGERMDIEMGRMGPASIPPELVVRLEAGEGDKFEMLDDDHVLYYRGRILGEYEGFEPLDDYGRPNAGVTEIKINGVTI